MSCPNSSAEEADDQVGGLGPVEPPPPGGAFQNGVEQEMAVVAEGDEVVVGLAAQAAVAAVVQVSAVQAPWSFANDAGRFLIVGSGPRFEPELAAAVPGGRVHVVGVTSP
jgi:hypothetical protein